jgi:hypothetical protein
MQRFFGHTVARTNWDLMALIAAAPAFPGPGFIVPTRNHQVLAWCLASGLKLVMQLTLMTTTSRPAPICHPSYIETVWRANIRGNGRKEGAEVVRTSRVRKS